MSNSLFERMKHIPSGLYILYIAIYIKKEVVKRITRRMNMFYKTKDVKFDEKTDTSTLHSKNH